jgi:hypothetical protein
MTKAWKIMVLALVLGVGCGAHCQDAKQLVQEAVTTELAANDADHTRWLYFEMDRKPKATVKQWVAETEKGYLCRVVEENSRILSAAEQQQRMDHFGKDSDAQTKQRKAAREDERRAVELLKLLPQAFKWTRTGTRGEDTILHFKPLASFHAPNREARVFAAMEGDMAVDEKQHRIVSLQGRLIHDVKFGGGLLGNLEAGGSFQVERREVGDGHWQITETHVHIQGHALLFKSISEQEDDERSKFREIGDDVSFEQVEKQLLGLGQ